MCVWGRGEGGVGFERGGIMILQSILMRVGSIESNKKKRVPERTVSI